MGYGTNIGTSEERVGGDLTKILFQFNYNDGTDHASKIFRANCSLKSNNDFETALATTTSGNFTKMAGCDLSALFYPYRIASGVAPTMPTVQFTEYNQTILPYDIRLDQPNKVFNRLVGPSGDAMGAAISSDYYMGDTEFLRDTDDVRSVGLRLPIMGVGWGRTTTGGNAPAASGAASGLFLGGFDRGSMVDPKDYIAAPIDFRYDEVNKVWTTGPTESKGIITGFHSGSGFYQANEAYWNTNSSKWDYLPSGYIWSIDNGSPLYELGQFSFVASGTVVNIKQGPATSGAFINYFQNDRETFEAIIVDSWVNDVTIDPNSIYSEVQFSSTDSITQLYTCIEGKRNLSDTAIVPSGNQLQFSDFRWYQVEALIPTSGGFFIRPEVGDENYFSCYISNKYQRHDYEINTARIVPTSGQIITVERDRTIISGSGNIDTVDNNVNLHEFRGNFPTVTYPQYCYDGWISFHVLSGWPAYIEDTVGFQGGYNGQEIYPAIYHAPSPLYKDIEDFTASVEYEYVVPTGLGGGPWTISNPTQSGYYINTLHLVTQSADPSPAPTGNIISTRLFVDNRGHITGVTYDTITIPSGSLDERVAVGSGKTPGYLDEVLDTPDAWLAKTINGNVLEITHENADAVVADTVLNNVAEAGGVVTFTYADSQFDAKGHYIADVPGTFTFEVLAASDPWLQIAAAAGGATIAHIGPDVSITSLNPAGSWTSPSASKITLGVGSVPIDLKGHVVSADVAGNDRDVNFTGDNWLAVACSAAGGDATVSYTHIGPAAVDLTLFPVTDVTNPSTGVIRINSESVPIDSKGHVVEASGAANTHDITVTATSPLTRVISGSADNLTITLAIDFTAVSGYSAGAKQVLMNDNGTIKWVNTMECP